VIPFVKICGLTNKEDLLEVLQYNPHAIGFVTYVNSSRYISAEKVQQLCSFIPAKIKKVAVTVDDSLETLQKYIEAGVDIVQLHGDQTADFAASLPVEVWKALALRDKKQIEKESNFPAARFVIDSMNNNGDLQGGSGCLADWSLAESFVKSVQTPVLLAGGINADNIVRALSAVRPAGVDLSSGLEKCPGIKCAIKLRSFFKELEIFKSATNIPEDMLNKFTNLSETTKIVKKLLIDQKK